MRRLIGPRVGAVLMALLAVAYMVTIGRQAVMLLGLGDPVVVAMGAALLILPVLGAGAIVAELLFGIRSERLARELEAEDGLPEIDVPTLPSGRPDRAASAELFDRFAAETAAAEDDWRSWYRLALVYDSCGDRRRARSAVRRAIALHRTGRAGSDD